MLVLFETPAGYALFKVSDKGILEGSAEDVWKHFATPEAANSAVKLKSFHQFEDTSEALAAASSICDGTLDKGLKNFLKTNIVAKEVKDKLAVADQKLGGIIKEKLGIKVVYDATVLELMRGIRTQMESLITGLTPQDAAAMKLGLSHSLSRYKLKFSPDKVDTMIIQAIALLDELDKELNTYAMRVREWYGWHFPELGKIINDNILFARTVKKMGVRTNASKIDLSDVLPEEMETEVKEAAEVSMGTEIAEEDIDNIQFLAEQVISIAEYRINLYDYLRNRMNAIAPNLTVMVGELVGARLIAHAGSLMNLAKHPASTVQILGAEKALFRALKTKHDTPKYGLIYHASLVGQAAPKLKGKISRVLASKTALSVRMDALGDTDGVTIGFENRTKVEARLATLESGKVNAISGSAKGKAKQTKYTPTPSKSYNTDVDMTTPKKTNGSTPATPSTPAVDGDDEAERKAKKAAKKAKKAAEAAAAAAAATPATPAAEENGDKKKKKKDKKRKAEDEEPTEEVAAPVEAEASEKKKKKKKQKSDE